MMRNGLQSVSTRSSGLHKPRALRKRKNKNSDAFSGGGKKHARGEEGGVPVSRPRSGTTSTKKKRTDRQSSDDLDNRPRRNEQEDKVQRLLANPPVLEDSDNDDVSTSSTPPPTMMKEKKRKKANILPINSLGYPIDVPPDEHEEQEDEEQEEKEQESDDDDLSQTSIAGTASDSFCRQGNQGPPSHPTTPDRHQNG
eukprot:scaffold10984_cov105-Cylindrotheca_fusiformis.AAC.1